MIWILVTGLAACLFWYFLVKPLHYWSDRGVKQTKPWIFLGDMKDTIFRLMSFTEWVQFIYNSQPNCRYFGAYQFYNPVLSLRDPELIKQIAVKDFDYFTDHKSFADPDADPLWGGNLFSLRGLKWREMRATLSGSFTSSKMKIMYNLMVDAADNFVQYFLDKNEDIIEVEMKDAYTRYTNDVIATTAFGIKVDSLAEPENTFYLMGKRVTNFGGIIISLKFFGYALVPKLFKLLKIGLFERKATDFFKGIIEETITAREKQGIIRPDMINLLLEARKGIKHEENEAVETGYATVQESVDIGKFRQQRNLTNENITSQALIFFFAGFDTISTALCLASYELVVNQDIQDKLRVEINETDNENNGKITYDVLLKMKYMDMVVSEVLRKWPPIIATDRICTKPYTLKAGTPEETTVLVEEGILMSIPIIALHRDPLYYPNPDKFDPERFSIENKDNIRPYTYLPFGVGPRNCIGSRFALLELKALLFKLLLNFEIVRIKKTQIPLKVSKKSFNFGAEGGYWYGLKRIKN